MGKKRSIGNRNCEENGGNSNDEVIFGRELSATCESLMLNLPGQNDFDFYVGNWLQSLPGLQLQLMASHLSQVWAFDPSTESVISMSSKEAVWVDWAVEQTGAKDSALPGFQSW